MKSEAKSGKVTKEGKECKERVEVVVEEGHVVPGEEQLTISEMENVTTVFRYFETGLREATILPKVDMCRL